MGTWISPRLEKARLVRADSSVIAASFYRIESELNGEVAFNETDLASAEGKLILELEFSVPGQTGAKLLIRQELTLADKKITSLKAPSFEWQPK